MAPERPQRHRSVAGIAVLVAVAVGLAAWAVATSSLFAVRAVDVVGNVTLTAREVVRLSGIDRGENLFRIAPGRVEERIRRNPWVAEVTVQRTFPSTVVVQIRERSPVGALRDPDGWVVVGSDGTVLDRRARAPRNLPSLGAADERLAPGSRAGGPDASLRVAASFPPRLRRAVAAVSESDGEVVLRLRPRGRVLYGAGEGFTAKNQAILSMLRWAGEREVPVGHIDVRVPASPALRPAEEEPHAAQEQGPAG